MQDHEKHCGSRENFLAIGCNGSRDIDTQLPFSAADSQNNVKSLAYRVLKKNRDGVEKVVKTDLVWFAKELNDDNVAVPNDSEFNVVINPTSMYSEDDKAMLVVKRLLNRVDLDPDVLGEFIGILKKEGTFNALRIQVSLYL